MAEIPGVIRIGSLSDLPRPHIGICGALHGNELCGLHAIERIHEELGRGQLELSAGTLYLIHGNPAATEEGERHTRGGVDLNRLFDYQFVTEVPPRLWVYEHQRALALRPLLESLDALLDLHSTTAPSPAFAIASPLVESRKLADALGLRYVTHGWDAPGLVGARVIGAPLSRRGVPGVSVECGQHAQPESVDVAYQCIRRALEHLGGLAGGPQQASPIPLRLRLRAAIKRPSANFKFAHALSSMQELSAGELIGYDDDLSISARRSCYAIMPNDNVSVGEDMLYIAEPDA